MKKWTHSKSSVHYSYAD